MTHESTSDLGDPAHHDDQPDHLDHLIGTLLSQHLRMPTIEELTGVLSRADLVWGACTGFTGHQARVIANNREYLRRLTRIWNIQVPDVITGIAAQATDLGALHRALLEATGHPLPQDPVEGLDEELWALLDELTVSKGATRGLVSLGDPDQAATLTCTDPSTGAQITLTSTSTGTWTAYLEAAEDSLTGATLHLRWADGSTTTHPIPATEPYEEATITIAPPAPGIRPREARITTA